MHKNLVITHDFRSPQARVFAALDDHANMGRWLGSPVAVIKSAPDGGVGTVRRIDTGVLRLDEEIVGREIPSKLAYRVIAGLPGLSHHFGEVTVTPVGEGRSHVRWRIEIGSRIPGFPTLLAVVLRGALKRALVTLDRQLTAN